MGRGRWMGRLAMFLFPLPMPARPTGRATVPGLQPTPVGTHRSKPAAWPTPTAVTGPSSVPRGSVPRGCAVRALAPKAAWLATCPVRRALASRFQPARTPRRIVPPRRPPRAGSTAPATARAFAAATPRGPNVPLVGAPAGLRAPPAPAMARASASRALPASVPPVCAREILVVRPARARRLVSRASSATLAAAPSNAGSPPPVRRMSSALPGSVPMGSAAAADVARCVLLATSPATPEPAYRYLVARTRGGNVRPRRRAPAGGPGVATGWELASSTLSEHLAAARAAAACRRRPGPCATVSEHAARRAAHATAHPLRVARRFVRPVAPMDPPAPRVMGARQIPAPAHRLSLCSGASRKPKAARRWTARATAVTVSIPARRALPRLPPTCRA